MAQSRPLSAETETLGHVLGLVEAFRAFDSDNDGSITAQELQGILSSLGYKASEQDARAMMQQGDADRDGLLSLDEFLEMNTVDMDLGGLANQLGTAIESLSVDGGDQTAVTAEELHEVLGNIGGLSLLDCRNIIASMDGDGDGAVSFEDFQLIVNSLI